MVENSKIDGIKSDIGIAENAASTKRKIDEILQSDDNEEQNPSKRAKVEYNNNNEVWAPHYGLYPPNAIDGSHLDLSDEYSLPSNANSNVEMEHVQNSNESYIISSNEMTIRFISVKKLGSKLKNHALYKKVMHIGEHLNDGQILKSRTAYWLLVDSPCGLGLRALGNSLTGLKANKEWLVLQIKERLDIENASLFQIYAPKQAGYHELTFSDGIRRTIRIVQVVTDSHSDGTDPTEQATNETEQSNNDNAAPSNSFDINAIVLLFNEGQLRILQEVLRRLKFSPEIESRNLQLWRRHSVRTSSILIYKNFSVQYLLNFREYLTLADGVLLLLPPQSEKDYELSEIGDIKLSCATFDSHETALFLDQSMDVQYALAASKSEREHHSLLTISAVHSGGANSIAYLEKYLSAWLAINLRPKVVQRLNLYQCFHFEEEVNPIVDLPFVVHG